MRKLLIIGAGGHGAVLANIADAMGVFTEISFLDDGNVTQCLGYPVIGKAKGFDKYCNEYVFIVAIGNNAIREKICKEITRVGGTLATLIHPNAVIGKEVTIGAGSVVMAGAIIEPRTIIGEGCIINTAASLNHDVLVEDYTHIAVGVHVAGTVKIGAHSWLGIGATVKNNITICSHVIIGAGCVVVKDITKSGTYIGVPAKRCKA